jgi:hypothetical protein
MKAFVSLAWIIVRKGGRSIIEIQNAAEVLYTVEALTG